jgi:hypothetical protein
VPVHRGFFVPDLRTAELAWWEERQHNAAFVQLEGQQGVSEARVTEVPAGKSLPAYKMAIDEVVYVLSGRGVTNVWSEDPKDARSFEWQPRALFLVPHGYQRQFVSMQGDTPARLLHYSYLPVAMSIVPDPDFFLKNPYQPPTKDYTRREDFYSGAKFVGSGEGLRWHTSRAYWYGNYFPDMLAWEKLRNQEGRGGSKSVTIQFAGSDMSCHMSVFAPRTYKPAHRHGPGRVIVIPGGEGYSLLWEQGKERVIAPWHEGSMFVPPNKWYHQHFNLSGEPARYLALHPMLQFHGHDEKVVDRKNNQIEYVDEDPWVRQYFETELDKRGLKSSMPADAYQNAEYVFQQTPDDH